MENEDGNLTVRKDQQPLVRDSLLVSLVTVLGAIPALGPVLATVTAGSFTALQNRRTQEFIEFVEKKINRLEKSKIDKNFLSSPKAIDIFLGVEEAVVKTVSEVKLKALAQALISCFVFPTSQVSGKEIIIRVTSLMADEEIDVLAILHHLYENRCPDEINKRAGIPSTKIAKVMNRPELDVRVACEGLLQLGLVFDALTATYGHFGNEHQVWMPTALGHRVVQFSQQIVEV